MRAGLSTIQQTLTPDAAAVLNKSIAEASRRSHGQTTPLHVAAILLASPSGYLRQACIRSHPNSSHPLRSRALELCFSVALDRLPSGNGPPNSEPPISNALLAALKRAQAHQRKGCPEQQQQPFLAVKVELKQLIVSILDDPSVSRVMKEAKFSSPAVKAAIEQSIASSSLSLPSPITTSSSSAVGLVIRPTTPATTLSTANRNLYHNPRIQQLQQSNQKQQQPIGEEEVRKVLDVLSRNRKRNPVLVGDSEPEALLKEVLQKIENKDVPYHTVLKNVHLLNLDRELGSNKSQISTRIVELTNSIETQILASGKDGCGGVIVNLGDLKWLVENLNGSIGQIQHLVSEIGRTSVTEIGKMLARFNEEEAGGGGGCRVWLTGTASCATYLRCQVYHPNMENDWDLQAVPIATRSPASGGFLRKGVNGIPSASVGSLAPQRVSVPSAAATANPLLSRRPSENTNPSRRTTMCPLCTANYEHEKAFSNSKPEATNSLPPWLEAAKLTASLKKRELELKSEENNDKFLKRWQETCLRVHPTFHTPAITGSDRPPLGSVPSVHNLYNPKLLQPHSPKKLPPVESLLNPPLQVINNRSSEPTVVAPIPRVSPRGSPVRTGLALGQPITTKRSEVEQCHKDRVLDLTGSTPDFFPKQNQLPETVGDIDSFKRLFKGLTEKISWQQDAASAVAVTVTQCRSGQGKRMSVRKKSDVWLLFLGPDKVGKKKMASALSELLFGMGPTEVSLGFNRRVDCEDGGFNTAFRSRKTTLDWIAEAVRRNPFSVFVIEDIDQADVIVQGKIKQAIESGRLLDSHGREASLGSAIFIMTADSLPDVLNNSAMESLIQCEKKLESVANCGWQLELLVGEKPGKRRNEWLGDETDRYTKLKTLKPDGSGLSLDLNLCTSGIEEDNGEGSHNSSDLTVEHEYGHGHTMLLVNPQPLASLSSSSRLTADIINAVDDAIVFKPVDFEPIRANVSNSVMLKFNSILGSSNKQQLKIEIEALEMIVSGIWFGCMDAIMFDDWMEKVLVPCFRQLKNNLLVSEGSVVRLVPVKEDSTTPRIYWLPSKISIANGEFHVL